MDVRKALLQRGRRRALEIGMVGLVCALAAGAVIGSGLAQTVLATPSPLTWLRNNKGQVVQVNPETGTMLQRLQIGDPGDPLKVDQDGTRLVITNLANGTVTVVDLSMLQVAGAREGDPDGVKVVLTGGQIFLVDKRLGRIEALDPLTAGTIGEPYQTDTQLTDVVADSTTALWAMTTGGRLVTVRWSAASRTFTEEQRRDLPGAGPGTALVAHQQGVTVITPTGQAIQVGTGRDRTVQVGGITPPLAAADTSPASLVPVASTKDGTVHLVGDNRAVTVDGPPLGCPKPDKPAVYRDRVYVPCRGDRKVVVLDAAGHRAEPDLATSGDAELLLNAGLLFVNVPAAQTSLVVKPDGTTQPITTDDPEVAVNDPNALPTSLPSGLGLRPANPKQPAGKQGEDASKAPATKKPGRQQNPQPNPIRGTPGEPVPDPGSSDGPGASPSGDGGPVSGPPIDPTPDQTAPGSPTPDPPSPSPTLPSPTPSDADYTPSGVDASTGPASSVLVLWTPPRITPDRYDVVRQDTGEVVASPPVNADQANIAGLAGQQIRFIVVAVTGGRRYESAPSGPVTPIPLPDAPSVSLQLLALSPTSFTVRVTVGLAAPATSYGVSVTVNGTSRVENRTDLSPGSPTSEFTFPCTGSGDPCLTGGSVTSTASVTSEGGLGPPGSSTLAIPGPPGFTFGQAFMYVSTGGKCLDRDIRLHTCTGSAGQLWVHTADRRAIRNQAGGCLAVNDNLHLAPDGCTDDPKKFTRINVTGNQAMLFSPPGGECIQVIGDPAGEGVQVLDRKNCPNDATTRWTAWRQPGGVPLTAARPASFTPTSTQDGQAGGLGAPAVALLLLPLAAGLARQRLRRRNAR